MEDEIAKGATGARKDVPLPAGDEIEPPFIAAYAPQTLAELAARVRAEGWAHFTNHLDAVLAGADDQRPSADEVAELLEALPEFLEDLAEEDRGVVTWLSF